MGKVSRGFTLLELVIVIGLITIMASIAVPGLHSLLSYGHRAAEINRLHRDLAYARSEAIARGMVVSLCTSRNGRDCSTDADWNDGWIVFADKNGDLDRDPGDEILRVKPPFASTDRLTGNRLVAHHLGYQREGFLKGLHNGTIAFSTTPDRPGLRRCLVISRTGRIRAVGGSDPLCGNE